MKLLFVSLVFAMLLLPGLVSAELEIEKVTEQLHYWSFDSDKRTGNVVADLNNESMNGTMQGTYSFKTTGKIGDAVDVATFASGAGRLYTPYKEISTFVSAAFWVKTNLSSYFIGWSGDDSFNVEVFYFWCNAGTLYVVSGKPFSARARGISSGTPCGSTGGSWQHWTVGIDHVGQDVDVWRNGASQAMTDSSAGSPSAFNLTYSAAWGEVNLTGSPSASYTFEGGLDEVLFGNNIKFNATHASELYNAGSGYQPTFSLSTTPPTVKNHRPTDGRLLNNDPVQLIVNTTCTNPCNITFYVNGSLVGTLNNRANGTYDFNITSGMGVNGWSESNWSWYANATDSVGTGTSEAEGFSYIVDRTYPIFNPAAGNDIAASNGTLWNLHEDGDTITANYNASDNYLAWYNASLYAPNGTRVYSHQASLAVQEYNHSFSYNLSGFVGNWTLALNASDDHTASWIPDYGYETTSNSVTFTTDTGTVCTIQASEANLKGLNVTKLTDRYVWSFEKNNAKTEHALDVNCSEPMNYRGDLWPFPNFVVGLNWIDFNVGEASYNVVEKNPNKYTITITTPEASSKLDFESIGGVNIKEEKKTFAYSVTPRNPASIAANATGTSWINVSWAASADASFYALYRDGTNILNTTALHYNDTGLSSGVTYTYITHSVYNLSGTLYENLTALPTGSFSTIFNGSLFVVVRNEVTNKQITGTNIFINLLSSTTNTTGNTSTGSIGLINLTAENYTIRHSGIGWGSRDQYIEIKKNQNGSIILYLINDSIRDPGIVYVRDTQSEGVNGSIIKINRYFSDENTYRTVQMATTNEDGRAIFDAEAYDGWYRWFVEYKGVTEITTTVPEFLSVSSTTGLWSKAFTINIGNDFWESYIAKPDMTHTVTYNNATRTLTYTFNDPAGIIRKGCIKAEFANGTRWQTLGPNCLTAAGGAVLLTLPNVNGSYHWSATYDTTTKYSGKTPASGTVTIGGGFAWGTAGAFIGLILFLGVIPLFAFNAVAGVAATIVLTVFLSLFGGFDLFPFQWGFVGAVVTLGLGFMLYAMRRS